MYRLLYWLFVGKFPCDHSWVKYGEYETFFRNDLKKVVVVNRCEKCGKMKDMTVRNYPRGLFRESF